jgi:hypothetical protein
MNKNGNGEDIIDLRWQFRLLLFAMLLFFFYQEYHLLKYNPHNFTSIKQGFSILFLFILFGILFNPIFKGEVGGYFFNYNLPKFKFKESNTIKIPRKIYFKQARIKFNDLICSKRMVQIWGILDLLTLIIFWDKFYNYILKTGNILLNSSTNHLLTFPKYFVALLILSLLPSAILLIFSRKSGYYISVFQMLIRMTMFLPSIFPILWLIGFENPGVKIVLVLIVFPVELIKIGTIEVYFKVRKSTIGDFSE